MNPWWTEKVPPLLVKTIRDFVPLVERRMQVRLAPAIVVRGPRQVGKTTAQLQIIERLIAGGTPPKRIMRLRCDELPSLASVREQLIPAMDWYENNALRPKWGWRILEG